MQFYNFFRYNAGERNAIVILLCVLLVLVLIDIKQLNLKEDWDIPSDSLWLSYFETKPTTPKLDSTTIQFKTAMKTIEAINLNTATVSELDDIPNIGEILSSRIVKYRQLLGGYYSLEQLKEVYGLSADTYIKILPYLYIRDDSIKKQLLDTISFRSMLKHPYAEYEDVKTILNLRDKKAIKSFSLLRGEIEDSVFVKLQPYFE